MIVFYIIMGAFVGLTLLGIPIAFSIGISTYIVCLIQGTNIDFIAQTCFTSLDSYSFIAIPLFILTGYFMDTGGLSRRIVAFIQTLIGNVFGGLGLITVIACSFFAAISGSGPATVAAIGGMMIPEMKKGGYDVNFAGSLTACAGSLGVLIPPSIPMVIYALIAEVSITELFTCGFIPGFLMAGALMLVNYRTAKKNGYKSKEVFKFNWSEVVHKGMDGLWALLTPPIILGGIYMGIFTATEAAAAAVFYSFIVAVFIYKELKMKDVLKVLSNAAGASITVLIIVVFATSFARFLIMQRVPQIVGQAVLSISNDPTVILLLFTGLILLTGCFMDVAAQILIYTPLFLPILKPLGVDPLVFGILLVIGTMIGMITPPVGACLYVAQGLTKTTLVELTKKLPPLLLAMTVVYLLLVFFPGITLFLVNVFMR